MLDSKLSRTLSPERWRCSLRAHEPARGPMSRTVGAAQRRDRTPRLRRGATDTARCSSSASAAGDLHRLSRRLPGSLLFWRWVGEDSAVRRRPVQLNLESVERHRLRGDRDSRRHVEDALREIHPRRLSSAHHTTHRFRLLGAEPSQHVGASGPATAEILGRRKITGRTRLIHDFRLALPGGFPGCTYRGRRPRHAI